MIQGKSATTLRVVSSPIMSAAKPMGVVQRFAIPQDTPSARELTVLRDSGHLFCAIAVVTGLLACRNAKPTISMAMERIPVVYSPVSMKNGAAVMLARRILSSPTVSASFPPIMPASVPDRVTANREKPPVAMLPPLVMMSIGRKSLIPCDDASLMLAIVTTPPTLPRRYFIFLKKPLSSAFSFGISLCLSGVAVFFQMKKQSVKTGIRARGKSLRPRTDTINTT